MSKFKVFFTETVTNMYSVDVEAENALDAEWALYYGLYDSDAVEFVEETIDSIGKPHFSHVEEGEEDAPI
jgi:hypothetical protein